MGPGVHRRPPADRGRRVAQLGARRSSRPRSAQDALPTVELGRAQVANSGVAAAISHAIREDRLLEIEYWTESRGAITRRTIEPHLLVNAQDAWYVVAHCRRAGGQRTFRLDRIRSAMLLDEHFERRPEITSTGPYMPWGARPQPGGTVAQSASVWCTPALARWMLEKHGSRERFADGSVLVEIPYASEDWLVKELLKYQGEAVLFEPVSLRRTVADLAEQVLGRYGADRPSGGGAGAAHPLALQTRPQGAPGAAPGGGAAQKRWASPRTASPSTSSSASAPATAAASSAELLRQAVGAHRLARSSSWTRRARPSSGARPRGGAASRQPASGQLGDDVVGVLQQRRARAQEPVAALGGQRPGQPGTASTGRPSSRAKSAVISAPERRPASTTATACASPATIRLRAGKRHGAGAVPGQYSDTSAPRLGDPPRQGAVAPRIGHVDPAPEHRHREPARRERALVGRGVDPVREAADDDGARARPGRPASVAGERAARRPSRGGCPRSRRPGPRRVAARASSDRAARRRGRTAGRGAGRGRAG